MIYFNITDLNTVSDAVFLFPCLNQIHSCFCVLLASSFMSKYVCWVWMYGPQRK